MTISAFISPLTVSKLKKEAKRIQRATGRAHHEVLDETARGAGFPNWHHLTLAQTASQQLLERFQSGFFFLWNLQEGEYFDADFEQAPHAQSMLQAEIVSWLRGAYNDTKGATDEELRADVAENFVLFIYNGSDPLPDAEDILQWAGEHCTWPPALMWLRGTQIDLMKGVRIERPNH
jgi:hypothetical protein